MVEPVSFPPQLHINPKVMTGAMCVKGETLEATLALD